MSGGSLGFLNHQRHLSGSKYAERMKFSGNSHQILVLLHPGRLTWTYKSPIFRMETLIRTKPPWLCSSLWSSGVYFGKLQTTSLGTGRKIPCHSAIRTANPYGFCTPTMGYTTVTAGFCQIVVTTLGFWRSQVEGQLNLVEFTAWLVSFWVGRIF